MSTRRRLFLSAPLIPIATLALWGGPVFAGDPAAAIVKLKDIKFTPGRVVISPGQSVTWEFLDADILTSHNVTSVGRLRSQFTDDALGQLHDKIRSERHLQIHVHDPPRQHERRSDRPLRPAAFAWLFRSRGPR